MSAPRSGRDSFVHALLSPLAALQGAIGLLQRRLRQHEDASVAALLLTLERSVERLRAVCELLLLRSTVDERLVRIELPVELIPKAGVALAQPSALASPGAGSGLERLPGVAANEKRTRRVLVIAARDSYGADVAEALSAQGFETLLVSSAALGLDQARAATFDLLVLDPAVDPQGEPALRVLQEDPNTKGVALAVVSQDLHHASGRATLLSPATPLAQAVQQLQQALGREAVGREHLPHILVVDDEVAIARLMALQFSDEGFQTTVVHSGTDALRVAREQSFDLILLDLMLPDIDGFTALGGLRAQQETQLTPIILVSALDSPAEKVRGLQLGADDYITKPFSAAELSARVQAAMRRSEREGGANPSTRLPGNLAIERAISQRIAQEQPFAVCYGDLDNFKAYNDSYGFLKGDALIQRSAQILLEATRSHGNPDDFVGHIGGDDFVLITTPERAEPICAAMIAQFDATVPLFYDAETRARGFLSGVDRQGRLMQFPLASISFAVVSSAVRPFSHPGEVAQRAVEVKKRAKLAPGSVVLLEA